MPAANTAFTAALALDPANAAARRGLARAEVFDQVMALLTEAKGYERMNDTAHAADGYRAALTLDQDVAEARLALARIDASHAAAAYEQHMSKGFKALAGSDFAPESEWRSLDPQEWADALVRIRTWQARHIDRESALPVPRIEPYKRLAAKRVNRPLPGPSK